jgi:hypothetical protein
MLWLAACGQKTNCSGISFGATGGSSGSGGGGVSSGNNSCGSNGGGNGGGGSSALDYLYTVVGNNIQGAFFDGTKLAPIVGFTQPDLGAGGAADMMIVGGKYLYQPWAPTGSTTSQINAFNISMGGALAAITGSPFTLASAGDTFATDPTGKFLFIGQSGAQTISVMQVSSTNGALTLGPGSPFPVGFVPTQLTVDGTGHYLYATISVGSGLILGWSIDQTTGAITPLANSPYFLGISRLAAHPSGNFLLGVGGGAITTILINPTTGDLAAGVSFTGGSSPDEVLIHPTGNFVYTFNRTAAPIEGFTVDGSGNLTALAGSPFSSLTSVTTAKIDQNGTAMVGLTGTSNQFIMIVVDPKTGALTEPGPVYIGTASDYFAITN